MRKYSKQRNLIYDSLKNRKDHPTAEMLYEDLKKELSTIGIATVYRNLVSLCEDNKIIKLKVDDGPDRFDGETKKHLHLYCEDCGKIIDIFLTEDEEKRIDIDFKKICDKSKVISKDYNVTINGMCSNC